MSFDWDAIIKQIPKVVTLFKKRIAQRVLDKKASKLYVTFKRLILGIQEYFSTRCGISLSTILFELSRTQNVSGGIEPGFLQLYRKSMILNNWFNSFGEGLKRDFRKENFQSLILKINNLNSVFRNLESEVIIDFKKLINQIGGPPVGVRSNYQKLRDGLNRFLTDYEVFLKKCQRELGGLITPMYFEGLE